MSHFIPATKLLRMLGEGHDLDEFEVKPADGTGPLGCWAPLEASEVRLRDVHNHVFVFRKKGGTQCPER